MKRISPRFIEERERESLCLCVCGVEPKIVVEPNVIDWKSEERRGTHTLETGDMESISSCCGRMETERKFYFGRERIEKALKRRKEGRRGIRLIKLPILGLSPPFPYLSPLASPTLFCFIIMDQLLPSFTHRYHHRLSPWWFTLSLKFKRVGRVADGDWVLRRLG